MLLLSLTSCVCFLGTVFAISQVTRIGFVVFESVLMVRPSPHCVFFSSLLLFVGGGGGVCGGVDVGVLFLLLVVAGLVLVLFLLFVVVLVLSVVLLFVCLLALSWF